jgi:hypothetical protein
MIKILLLSTIIVLTTALGYLMSTDKKKRKNVFEELYEFNEQLILNLKYGKEQLSVVANSYKYVSLIINGQKVLDGEDGQFIDNYIKNLGATDAISQIDYLNERKLTLKKYKDESAENYKKYSSLYLKISFMTGILIAVLLA